MDPEQQPELARLLKVLTKSQKVVVIAGAGISVSAGSKWLFVTAFLPTGLTSPFSPRFSLR